MSEATTAYASAAARKNTAPRVYHIPIPTGQPIVCRKVLLALTEWRAIACGIQHFDEESGRATLDDLHIIQASSECRIDVLLHDKKTDETFWAPAVYDATGEYAETERKPERVRVVIRTNEATGSERRDSDEHWAPTEVIAAPPKREAPAPVIGRARRGRGGTAPAVTLALWENTDQTRVGAVPPSASRALRQQRRHGPEE